MAEMSFTAALRQALREEMQRDERVCLIGEDIGRYGGAFGVTAGLLDEFGPKRVIECPISENSFVGVAVGAAMTGLRPIVEIMFMDFILLAADQIINHAAKLHYIYNGQVSVPLVIRAPTGAGRGYGASHSQSLEALFMQVPGLSIVVPYTPAQARGLLKSAVRANGPVLFVEHKLLYSRRGEVSEGDPLLPLGRAEVLQRGEDVTIVSYGHMLDIVAEALEGEARGVSAEVINLLSLSPLDADTVAASVQRTGHLVVVEEGVACGGVGAEISALIAERCMEYLDGPIARVGTPKVPVPASRPLEDALLPSASGVAAAIHRTLAF
jgi:pyruvate dehydrogenase E1 component beta subunit